MWTPTKQSFSMVMNILISTGL